jgi:voltage-dependent potassium channel beta subunit
MQYRRVGSSGLMVSAISLGAWINYGSSVTEENNAIDIIRRAIGKGINYIDVADVYTNGAAETVVGRAIKGMKRSDLVISTKAFWPMSDNVNDRGLSRKHLIESVNASLKRFNTEYVDLFFCHRFDPDTPLDETVRAIETLIQQGKIMYWGTSMWTAANLDAGIEAVLAANTSRPIVEQPLYNMLDRQVVEGDLESALDRHGMGLVVWSPLAQGVLTGKYNDGIPADSRYNHVDKEWFAKQLAEDRLAKSRALYTLAREMSISQAALALAWVLKNRHVSSAIIGATKPAQLDENLKALDVEITDDVNQKIEAILNPA